MSKKLKRILTATIFNLFFEYSIRGVNNLPAQPFLPIILFISYFTYFTMLEDLIARYRLKDYHLIMVSFIYGTVALCFASGLAFTPPLFLGINWIGLVFVNLVWWGALQAVATFYLANRMCPREWNSDLLSKNGWAVALLLNASTFVLFQFSGLIPKPTVQGLITAATLILALTVLLWRNISNRSVPFDEPSFRKSRFMDVLVAMTILVFLVCAVFLTRDPVWSGASLVNRTSLHVVTVWTIILALLVFAYRLISKRPIPI